MNTLQTNYRREKKKVEESCHSGSGTYDIYEPSLWYFHLFHFLGDQDTPRFSSSNLASVFDFVYSILKNKNELLK